MKCPKCDSDELDLTVQAWSIYAAELPNEYVCQACGWQGGVEATIRTKREIAADWMFEYIYSQQQFDADLFIHECWPEAETDSHIGFVCECLDKGIKPIHFIDKMIDDHRDYVRDVAALL